MLQSMGTLRLIDWFDYSLSMHPVELGIPLDNGLQPFCCGLNRINRFQKIFLAFPGKSCHNNARFFPLQF